MRTLTIEQTTVSEIAQDIEEGISELTNLPTSLDQTDDYIKNLVNLLQEFAVTYGGKLIGALLLLIIGFKLTSLITKKIAAAKALNKIDASTRGFIQSVINVLLKCLVGITALAVLGVPMTSMIAVIGSCGLAVGLALQGSLSNIAGGFIILVFKPFSVGDYITSGEISGTVEDIGIFHTKVLTNDNRRIIVPNSTISNATLTNVSALSLRRVDLTFTASYNTDISLVEKTLLSACENHSMALSDPAPFARLSAHKDSALEYTVRVWCKADDYWTLYFDLIRDVKYAFDKAGVEIPYPQVNVHTAK
ncbi:MAG: mechanosensitive ion channel family protein [Clostridia bacterium]|nr:mechanosensitive ion channel family protein [Clostridia bacterium]